MEGVLVRRPRANITRAATVLALLGLASACPKTPEEPAATEVLVEVSATVALEEIVLRATTRTGFVSTISEDVSGRDLFDEPFTVLLVSSETGGGCVYDGVPLGTVHVRESDGRLELGGPVLAEGYLDASGGIDRERTDSVFHIDDGIRWYRTGDLGSVGADGVVSVMGRADNVIISGGEKVSLDDVERSVRRVSGFQEAVVVAADSEEWGQVPAVAVVRQKRQGPERETRAISDHGDDKAERCPAMYSAPRRDVEPSLLGS